MLQTPALVRPAHAVPAPVRAVPTRGTTRPAQSAIYRRRLTVQAPLQGHRVVAARLSKIP